MNDIHDENTSPQRRSGPDALASLIRGAGKMAEPRLEFRAALRKELETAWQQEVTESRRRRVIVMVAALLLFAVGVQLLLPETRAVGTILRAAETGLQVLSSSGNEKVVQVGDEILIGSRITTTDSRAAMRLGGSFNVRFDRGTQLTVQGEQHLVLEQGRIYVDSGSASPTHGLVIDTPFGTVRDIGTQFTISLQSDDLVVQVREGLVKIKQSASAMVVTPGQRLRVGKQGGVHTESIALSGEPWLWTETVAPALVVDGKSVHAFLEAIHRQTGLEIMYATPQAAMHAKRTLIRGRHPDFPPRQMLDVVMAATNFTHKITDTAIIVRAK